MVLRRCLKNRVFFNTLVLLFLFSSSTLSSAAIIGIVTGPDGALLEASIRVFENNTKITSFETGSNGVFNITLPPGQYTLIVSADDPETPGFDYVPAAININREFDGEINLIYGSTLSFLGDIQFVDTENLPLKTTYMVQDQNRNILVPTGFPLQFSDKRGIAYSVPELPPKAIILPADSIVDVNVSSSILIDTQISERGFLIKNFKTAGVGETRFIDFRLYTIPISQSLTTYSLEELETRLAEMDQYGFYLAKQETARSNGINYVTDSETFYYAEDFDKSFGSLKRGFLLFTHTNNELLNMYRDAKLSVLLLIAFLTVASLVSGSLLIDGFLQQSILDIIILGISLIFFYYTYPGSKTIPLSNFILASTFFLAAFRGLGTILPRLFTGGGTGGRVHTRNLIPPIFNIAKRSLRRRKIKFMLTFISLTLMVMSFVTLTSFSEGYGLITGKSPPKVGWTGVYIREGSWNQEDPSFILVNDAELNWITSQTETHFISIKAESIPLRIPTLRVGDQPIFGIIGVSENELSFIDIEATIVSGDLPSENGVLISESFSEATELVIGDRLTLELKEYVVDGIFNDELFTNLKDLDGTPYSSNKWVNISPEGESPTWVLVEAAPNEVIIMSSQRAVGFPTVGVQRIAIKVNSEYNATGFAERLALERGYLTWANSLESYTFYRLGNYFQGKGATLFIPWLIVVLNVIVTMLSNLYERRKEIEIFSSVGLNPAQVSSVFVTEAAITGFIAGGLGYLIGLGFYKALSLLNIGLQVHQKVSAVWSLAAIGLAISAVVTGAYTALQNSVVITPSLMRRWKLNRTTGSFNEPWRIDIPIKLDSAEVRNYLEFVEYRLRRLMNHHTLVISSIKRGDMKLEFVYKSVQMSTGKFYTKNTLHVYHLENEEFGAILESLGETEAVHVTGSLIRQITMDYSTFKRV